MFYDLYVRLCQEKNVSPTRAAIEIGISKATPTTWKKRGLTPQGETLGKIAEYFGVTTDFLLGKTEKEERTAVSDADMKVAFFSGADIPDEEMEALWQDAKDYINFKINQKRKRS